MIGRPLSKPKSVGNVQRETRDGPWPIIILRNAVPKLLLGDISEGRGQLCDMAVTIIVRVALIDGRLWTRTGA